MKTDKCKYGLDHRFILVRDKIKQEYIRKTKPHMRPPFWECPECGKIVEGT